jgi:cytoskeletal protein CcmA (bactofilin family)
MLLQKNMFNNSKKTIERKGNGTYLSETLHIDGEITSTGSVELAGLIDGNINSDDLIILDTGSIKGNVKANSVSVDGQVEGNIDCTYLFLGKNAVIRGNLYFTETLKTEEGADVDGYIKKTAKQGSKEKKDQNTGAKLGKPILVQATDKKAV